MLEKRWADTPDKPPNSRARSYFGPRVYEDETISLYLDEHAQPIDDLLGRADRLGRVPEGWADLTGGVTYVDHIWRLRDRLTPIIKQLRGKYQHPSTLSDRVEYLRKVGGDLRSAIRSDGPTFGQHETTPYQAFETWRYDVKWLLGRSAPDVWSRFQTKPVPARESSLADLAAYIDVGLDALGEVDV
jgi:hypothetical protein